MNRLRMAVALLLVLVWGLFVPVAMAADHCAAMNSMCEGPCGASSTATPPAVPTYTVLVSRAPTASAPSLAQSERPTLEPPPKSPIRFA
jgi:hypothetical protein